MKKVLAITLALLMLASVMVVPSFAVDAGLYGELIGPSAPGVAPTDYVSQTEYNELVASDTATADTVEIDGKHYSYKALGENLTLGLNTSAHYKDYGSQANGYGDTTGTYALSAAQLADIADTKYGISVIGFTHIRRKLSTISDGKWCVGGNAFEGRWDRNFYDVTGKTTTTEVNTATGNVYTCLFTYNFKEVKTVDYLILADSNNQDYLQNLLQSADIYISNDGKNWTLASYWDIAGEKIGLGSQTNFKTKWRADRAIKSHYLGIDEAGSTTPTANTTSYNIVIDLGSLQTQYVRIAVNGSCGETFNGTWKDRSQHMTDLWSTTKASGLLAFRDIMLIGGDAEQTTPETLTGANYLGRQTALEGSTFSTRYVATIDSLNYAKAGFKVKIHYFDSTGALTAGNATEIYAAKAYKEIKQYGLPNAVAKDGEWFILFTLQGLSTADQADFIIEVTPFTEDGTGVKTYGDTCRETFIDGVWNSAVMIPQ